jgi:hypothetical protein
VRLGKVKDSGGGGGGGCGGFMCSE